MTFKPASLFILFFWLMTFSAYASARLDFQTVDMLTYRCYTEQKWDSVILVGKKALKQDIDYYYLRVRMGISYYQIKEYFPASTHLKKAREFNSGDSYVTDYLYWSYIYTNRIDEALLLKAYLAPKDRDTADSRTGFLQQIHFESGYTLSSDRAPKNLGTLMGSNSIYGEQDLYDNYFYGNFGLNIRASNRLSFSLAYNYLNFAKTKYVQYGRSEARLDSISYQEFSNDYFYSFPWKVHDTAIKYNVKQNEAYLGATLTLPWGIKIMPAVHWINVKYNITNTSFRTDSISDTAFYSTLDSTYHMFTYPLLVYRFTQKDTTFNNFVAALRISKDIGRFVIGLAGSWSNLNGKTQYQAGASLTYFPLGNLNFYGTTEVTGFFQSKNKRLLFSQVLGAKLTPWLWGEANFYYGDYTNANIFNGAIVYNKSDNIDYSAGASLVFVLSKHIQLSLIYQYFRKESQQTYIKIGGTGIKQQIQNNPYNTNSIIGGITWKF